MTSHPAVSRVSIRLFPVGEEGWRWTLVGPHDRRMSLPFEVYQDAVQFATRLGWSIEPVGSEQRAYR
jgi:hypothetical protein